MRNYHSIWIFITVAMVCWGAVAIAAEPTAHLVRREFYITRHGQSDHNARGIVGNEKAELTAEGRAAAKALSASFFAVFPEPQKQVYLVSSDLKRAKDTAALLSRGQVKVIADARLNERVSGDLWEVEKSEAGRLLVLLKEGNAEYVLDLLGTERAESHIARITEGTNFHLRQAPPGMTPVFVSHLKTMLELAALAGHQVENFDNTTLFHFIPEGDHGWVIKKVTRADGVIIEK